MQTPQAIVFVLALRLLWLQCNSAQQLNAYYLPAWLYETAAIPEPAALQSLSFTGAPTFPPPTENIPTNFRSSYKPQLLKAAAFGQTDFRLPFRPSPFAGYSDEPDEPRQQQQQQQQLQQEQLTELPFHAPGYFRPIGSQVKPVTEQPEHFIYMSPTNLYSLFRS